MKKLLFILLTLSCVSLNAQVGLRPRGDVNCDWEVGIDDIMALIDSISNGAKYHALYSYAADVNGNKEIDIDDLSAVIHAILGGTLAPMPSYSGTLPVLFINTEGHRNIDSKEEYLHADWWLDNMGIKGYKSIGSPDEPLGMQIKGRGNSTWTNIDKKPFRLKLDEKQEMLGMPSSKHWILLAYAEQWMGKMNDVLPFEIGRRMGMAWNPGIEPVEVVLNGQYIGLYFLAEKIRIAKDRVNIEEQLDNEQDPAKVTGGWILEIDNYPEQGNITVKEPDGQTFWVTPHSPEQLSDVQRDYITTFLTKADKAISKIDAVNREWEKYIDIDSLAIYYIVQEAVDNPEAFSGSCYMHKQRGANTKLIFGPLWDCGSSFTRYSADYEFNDFIFNNMPDYCQSVWISKIAASPRFQICVKKHWKQFYDEVYPAMDAYLDAFVARLERAGMSDYTRWPRYSGNNLTTRMNTFYKPSFHKKVEWLNTKWGDIIPPNPDHADHEE